MILKFINRKDELKFLEHRYRNKTFEFFVVYGRRRVGKTELIKHFLENKEHIYLLCDKGGTERNIYRFKKKISEYLNEPLIASNDLEEIFTYLTKKLKKKIIIVFDEFSYLIEKDYSITSLFQVICDELLKNKNIFLIVCGSSVSMMEEGVLSKKSPLYGRKTAHINLKPIPFKCFNDFFPENDVKRNIEFYSVLGGIPFYLEKFSGKKTILENVKEQIWSKEGRLYEEIDFLLREELREPDVYKTILNAIASGKTKVVDIANSSNIKVQDIDKYLKVLIKLGIIKKENPVTETKSKKSLYSIDDNFFSFCFKFTEPFKSDLEIKEIKNAESKFTSEFSAFVGKRFEKLIKEEILRITKVMNFEKIGRWWGYQREGKERKSEEIDIVAIDKENKEILFAECKWQDNINSASIAKELIEKAKHVEWKNNDRKENYAVFAKSFSKKIDEFEGKKVSCYDLKDIEKLIGRC